jgi:hypothetical protein
MDPVTVKCTLTGDILGTSKPSEDGRSEAVSVGPTECWNSVQRTNHLDTAESDEVLDPYIVTLFSVEELVLAVMSTGIKTSLIVTVKERVKTSAKNMHS